MWLAGKLATFNCPYTHLYTRALPQAVVFILVSVIVLSEGSANTTAHVSRLAPSALDTAVNVPFDLWLRSTCACLAVMRSKKGGGSHVGRLF